MKKLNLIIRLIPIITYILLSIHGFGQEGTTIQFSVKDLEEQPVYLYSYYGDQRIQIDSAISNNNGDFSFHLPPGLEPGIYHVRVGKDEGMDFVVNGENTVISIDRSLSPDNAIVENSIENTLLFDYISKKKYYEQRLELLTPVVFYYPPEDPFYAEVEEQYNLLEKEYEAYLERIYTGNTDLIVTRFIKLDQLQDIRPGEVSPEGIRYLKQHYFDGIDLADTLLLYSPLLPGRIIDYLSLFVSQGGGKGKQEELFKQAIDSLMAFTLPGNKVREVVVNYLIEGFQAYGLEEVMSYLVENYVLNQSCVSEQREETLRKRIEGFKRLAVGNKVPDIIAEDITGEKVVLSSLPYEYTILFFWSSDCPHCSSAIPDMNRIGKKYSGRAAIVAVSVDKEEAAWKQAVRDKSMEGINIAELKGWDGKIVSDYFIYATPTILVLDSDLQILAKPTGVRGLESFMEGAAGE